jgi:hypothetical protein
LLTTLSVGAVNMAGKTGVSIMGPQKVSVFSWYNDDLSYGVMVGYDEGLLASFAGNYVIKKLEDNKLRFSLTGGYTYTPGSDRVMESDIYPRKWYGIGSEYIFGKFSVKAFYGKIVREELGINNEKITKSKIFPKLEFVYYW